MPTSAKNLRTCSKGHQYFKSSDCPICPVCEAERRPVDSFPAMLAAPARRAMEREGIITLEQLSTFDEEDILKLHGIGPSSLPILKSALAAKGLAFKTNGRH